MRIWRWLVGVLYRWSVVGQTFSALALLISALMMFVVIVGYISGGIRHDAALLKTCDTPAILSVIFVIMSLVSFLAFKKIAAELAIREMESRQTHNSDDELALFLQNQEALVNAAESTDFQKVIRDSLLKILPMGIPFSVQQESNHMVIDMMLPTPRRVSVSVTAIPKREVVDNQKFNFISGESNEVPDHLPD